MGAGSMGALAAMLLLASCAGASANPPRPASSEGLLVVTQEMASGGSVYIEGYVPFFTVSMDGQEISKARMQGDRPVSRRLAVGAYLLTFLVHPCDANCGFLDPVAETCSATFTLQPDQTVKALVIERPARGCSITFTS